MAISCALLMYVRAPGGLRVLLVHPGGPYWRGKDASAWSLPKGLAGPGEDLLAAARREFVEETNLSPHPPFLALGARKQSGGKLIHCWAFEGKENLAAFKSNQFKMEWPPGSGRTATFPEADAARLFDIPEALVRIHKGQAEFLIDLQQRLGAQA
jgi:predicted NUDIX family NTP pyrophosphohydrolase